MPAVELIVGLGNPGSRYEPTRHNVGFWFVDALLRSRHCELRPAGRFSGAAGRCPVDGGECWVLKPDTFMNHSGQSVAALAAYYRLAPESVLVIHDDLDLEPGSVRLKRGGGHGGHNGLRDIVSRLGSREFLRLRLGIGHPGHRDDVVDYVLQRPSPDDREAIEAAIDEALAVLPAVVEGDMEKAMNRLHAR